MHNSDVLKKTNTNTLANQSNNSELFSELRSI